MKSAIILSVLVIISLFGIGESTLMTLTHRKWKVWQALELVKNRFNMEFPIEKTSRAEVEENSYNRMINVSDAQLSSISNRYEPVVDQAIRDCIESVNTSLRESVYNINYENCRNVRTVAVNNLKAAYDRTLNSTVVIHAALDAIVDQCNREQPAFPNPCITRRLLGSKETCDAHIQAAALAITTYDVWVTETQSCLTLLETNYNGTVPSVRSQLDTCVENIQTNGATEANLPHSTKSSKRCPKDDEISVKSSFSDSIKSTKR